jgi:hypothetical protein
MEREKKFKMKLIITDADGETVDDVMLHGTKDQIKQNLDFYASKRWDNIFMGRL